MSSSRQRSIVDCFRRASLPPRTTSCPICGVQVALKDINQHLDSPDQCRRKQEEREPFEDSDTEYDKLDVSSSQESNSGARSYSFEACAPKHFSPNCEESSSQEEFCSSPPSFRASRSVSRTPNKFSGVKEMRDTGRLTLVATPSQGKTRGSRLSPLPVGGRRTPIKDLFGEEPASSHVPLTPSKKVDPSHVPYYLVNFSHVVRCVVDESDDRELLSKEEIYTVEAFR